MQSGPGRRSPSHGLSQKSAGPAATGWLRVFSAKGIECLQNIETPPSRSTGPPCICRCHLVSPGVEAGGVDGFPVSIFRVSCWPPRVKAWPGCDLPAPRSYGPITQLSSEQGCDPSHCGNAAPKPATPKSNAARIMPFIMGSLVEVPGAPSIDDRRHKSETPSAGDNTWGHAL
jgi:hypothetical protein